MYTAQGQGSKRIYASRTGNWNRTDDAGSMKNPRPFLNPVPLQVAKQIQQQEEEGCGGEPSISESV